MSKIPATKQLINIHSKTCGGSVIGLEKVKKKDVSKYGVIKIKKKMSNFYSISNLVEKPKIKDAPSNLTIVGRYILNQKIFQDLSSQKRGFGGEIQLTDSLLNLVDTPGLFGVEFDGNRYDCGNKLGFIEANLNFGLKDTEIKSKLRSMLRKL